MGDPLSVQASALDRLLRHVADDQSVWNARDFPAVLAHQWDAPLLADLPTLADVDAAAVQAMTWNPDGPAIETFGQLLTADRPEPALLATAKAYFKPCVAGQAGHVPRDVAAVLYYAVIGVARATDAPGVSALEPARLAEGLDWALAQPWVSEPCRAALQRGRAAVG